MILRTHYKYLRFSIITLILILLTGCSTRVKAEQDIIADLQSSKEFISNTAKISNYEIIKRQTNKTDKTDIIYLTVCTDEPELICELSFSMKYVLYNEGWLLESIERYDNGVWKINGLSEDQIVEDSTAFDPFFQEQTLSIRDYVLTDEGYYYEDGHYEKWVVMDLKAHGSGFEYYVTYHTSYIIEDGTWDLEESYVESSHYSPTYSPNISVVDGIMDTLEVSLNEPYDSYEYLRTDENWVNCSEVRYYTAKKTWDLGTETYLVSIPLKFSLEHGENTSDWTYNNKTIKAELQSIDFNLDESRWGCSGYYDDVDLQIEQIVNTDDPKEYTAIVSCKAISRYTYCDTEGQTTARFGYSNPGDYFMIIESPDKESAYPWMGYFEFNSSSTHDYMRGVYWHEGSPNGIRLSKM